MNTPVSKTVNYKAYTIRSMPVCLFPSGGWGIEISIAWEQQGATLKRPFSVHTPHPTETAADAQGIAFGQRLIDGQVPGLSLDREQVLLPGGT
jgi:hypothetical protein